MLKFTERSKTPVSKKPVLSLKGISSFAGDFVLICMKQRLMWLWNQKWIVYHQGDFCRKFAAKNVQFSAPKYEHFPRGWSLKFK